MVPFTAPIVFPGASKTTGTLILELDHLYSPSQHRVNKRAWTLQERLLSPRLLYFINKPTNFLLWDCQCLLDSLGRYQPGRSGNRSHKESIGRLQCTLEPILHPDSHMWADDFKKRHYDKEVKLEWRTMVEIYMERGITKQSDRFLAIASLAAKLSAILPLTMNMPRACGSITVMAQKTL